MTREVVLNQERALRISAVEGLSLTPRMENILHDTRGLSGEERRAIILSKLPAGNDSR